MYPASIILLNSGEIREDDPIYGLSRKAESGGASLTNDRIDDIVYG
jgi:hypothetical protein